MTNAIAANSIEVRISSFEQLFNSLDPFPFQDRDLDKAAEEFIVGWARELPASSPIDIVIHLRSAPANALEIGNIEDAFHRYFAYRADGIGRDLNDLFRIGRRSLAIGVAVLVLCIGLRELVLRSFGVGWQTGNPWKYFSTIGGRLQGTETFIGDWPKQGLPSRLHRELFNPQFVTI